jgi:hypothetical protein
MNLPEKLATVGTQDTDEEEQRTKYNTTQKTTNMSNTDPTKTGGEPRRPRSANSCQLINNSWKPLCVGLLYTLTYTSKLSMRAS